MPEVKDKMTGKTVAQMSYDEKGMDAANKMVANDPGLVVTDGRNRSQQMYEGGGMTGMSMIGKPQYMKGGKMMYKHGGMTSPMKKMADGGMTPEMKKYEKGGKTKKAFGSNPYSKAKSKQMRLEEDYKDMKEGFGDIGGFKGKTPKELAKAEMKEERERKAKRRKNAAKNAKKGAEKFKKQTKRKVIRYQAKVEDNVDLYKGSKYDKSKVKYAKGGKTLKSVDSSKNPGLSKLPKEVRNKMGYMEEGGKMPKMMYGGKMKKMKKGGKAGFKPHMMYKDGKGVKANTYEKHLSLKKKGYGHSK
tara:strand:- start:490 stop:1395 length:906 start_codon:yes stop_codon:yes gene_type:complete